MRYKNHDQRGYWDNWEKAYPSSDKATGWRMALGWIVFGAGNLFIWAVVIFALFR